MDANDACWIFDAECCRCCVLLLSGALWSSLKLFGSFWSSLEVSGALWGSLSSLGLSGAIWGSLDLSGALWGSLGLSNALSEALWRSLALSGAMWGSLGLSGALWRSLALSGALWGWSGAKNVDIPYEIVTFLEKKNIEKVMVLLICLKMNIYVALHWCKKCHWSSLFLIFLNYDGIPLSKSLILHYTCACFCKTRFQRYQNHWYFIIHVHVSAKLDFSVIKIIDISLYVCTFLHN